MSKPFKPLDEKNLSWFHFKSMITTGMGVFTDGYDLSSIGIVLLTVLQTFGITKTNPDYSLYVSLITGSALMGSAVGAILFGFLSNKGRKTFYGVDVVILTIGALLQSLVVDPVQLIIARFILGLGIGADYVLSPMIMAEHSNARDRGKMLALGFGLFWGFGATTSALLYLGLSSIGLNPQLVWKVVLAAGAIPAASVIYLRRKIPETARYLGRIKGDLKELNSVIKSVTGEEYSVNTDLRDRNNFRFYLMKFWRQFLAACVLWFLFDIVAYAGNLFGPSLIASSLGINPGVFQIMIEGLFVIPGGIVALMLVDRIGRKPLQTIGFIGMALALLGFSLYKSFALSFSPIIAFLIYGLNNFASQAGPGSVSAVGILGVELAPTKIRGFVQSLTVASGRIGAALTAFVFPSLFTEYGESFAIGFLSAVAIVSAIVTLISIPETKDKSLEETSGELKILSA
ncbi:MFS transporter [Sulfolobus acidocaldarius SUSAZ]|nr:MFS transporter [Sulfolobus acidocaldarius SUSAZ]